MKPQLIKIVVLGVALLFVSQSILAQEKQNRNIFSIGDEIISDGWQMQYKIGVGREFQLIYGFSFTPLVEYAEYPRYQLSGNGSVLSSEASYSFSVSATLKISPPWHTAPYLACGVEMGKIYEGAVLIVDIYSSRHQTTAQWRDKIFSVLSAGVDLFHTDKISTFIELRINSSRSMPNSKFRSGGGILRLGIGFVL